MEQNNTSNYETTCEDDGDDVSHSIPEPDAKLLCARQEDSSSIDVRPKTQSKRSMEQKNTSDYEITLEDDGDDVSQYIPDHDAKLLCARQEVFLKPHVNRSPQRLIYDKTIVLEEHEHNCCWKSDQNDKIFVGGWKTIVVIREEGNLKEFPLWDSRIKVICGLGITSEKQLICFKDFTPGSSKSGIYTVNINEDMQDDTPLHPLNRLDVVEDPICLFNIDKLRYGVLCEGGTIEFFSLKNILLDRDPTNMNKIKLSTNGDAACATPEGNICVASYDISIISMYTINGELLHEYHAVVQMSFLGDAWYSLFSGGGRRLFLQCCEDGILVVNGGGVVCTLKEGTLTRVHVSVQNREDSERLGYIHDCLTTECRLWCVKRFSQNKVQLYKTSALTEADIDTEQMTGEVILKKPTISCPSGLKYDKTITTHNKHNCCWSSDMNNTIYLGGENTITILREDGVEQSYSISGNRLPSKPIHTIISGLAVTSNKHLVCVEVTDPSGDCKKDQYLYRLDIPNDIAGAQYLEPTRKFVVQYPFYIFIANELQYGVVCEARPFSDIVFFSWRDIILGIYNASDTPQSIRLADACSKGDTACSTLTGAICIFSIKNDCVYMYSIEGDVLEKFDGLNDIVNPNSIRNSWDWRNSGIFVQGCRNGILVTNTDGVVFKFKDGRWKVSKEKRITRLGQIHYCVYTGSTMWVIDLNDKTIVRIYTSKGSDGISGELESVCTKL